MHSHVWASKSVVLHAQLYICDQISSPCAVVNTVDQCDGWGAGGARPTAPLGLLQTRSADSLADFEHRAAHESIDGRSHHIS